MDKIGYNRYDIIQAVSKFSTHEDGSLNYFVFFKFFFAIVHIFKYLNLESLRGLAHKSYQLDWFGPPVEAEWNYNEFV